MAISGLVSPLADRVSAVAPTNKSGKAEGLLAGQQGRAANLTTLANNWYNDPNRATQRNDFMTALRGQLAGTTDRGFTNTSRQAKFATARQGLTGGAVDVSRQRRNLEDLFRTRIGNEAQVQDAGQQLRNQDLATRQSLIDQAYGVADVGADASRNLLSQQSQDNNYFSALWPQLLQRTGNSIAKTYGTYQNNSAFGNGYFGGAP